MDTNQNQTCPCCGRHCALSDPGCERGETYARTGVIPEKKSHGEHARHEHPERREEQDARGGYAHRDQHEAQKKHKHHDQHGEAERRGGHGGHRGAASVLDLEQYAEMDIDSKLSALLRDLGRQQRFGFGGKDSQQRILRILEKEGRMSQQQLTERLGIRSGSSSEVLGKLERAGMIVRTPNEEDRRSVTVSLTEAGRAQASEAAARQENQPGSMFGALSGDEKEAFLSLMEKLVRSWRKDGPTQE